jgi:hypothetical protein
MQQITVNSKDVIQWLKDRNKIKKNWGYQLKALHLQGKKVVEYLKTIKLDTVSKIIDESNFEKYTLVPYLFYFVFWLKSQI